MKHKPQGLHVSPLPTRTSLICCTHMMQPHSHHSFFVLGHQPHRIHLCLKLYIVHVNTFPSPNSRQLLNPGRLNDGSGQCPAATSGAFIICLVGSAPVSWGMQPPGAATIIPVAQVSSSLSLHATCWEDSTLHLQWKGRGWGGVAGVSKGQQPHFHCSSQLYRATAVFL